MTGMRQGLSVSCVGGLETKLTDWVTLQAPHHSPTKLNRLMGASAVLRGTLHSPCKAVVACVCFLLVIGCGFNLYLRQLAEPLIPEVRIFFVVCCADIVSSCR